MGKPSNEIITYKLEKSYRKDKVKIKIFPKHSMTGDVPLASYGGVLTPISNNTIALTGGVIIPNMNTNSGYNLLVNNANLEEERTVGTLHVLKIDKDLTEFEWESKGELFTSRAHHSAEYCKSSNKLIVIGGLHIENSSVFPGSRLCTDPLLISMTDFTVTAVTASNPLNIINISGSASVAVSDNEIVLFGGYTSERVHAKRYMNSESNEIHVIKFADDFKTYSHHSKEVMPVGFSMGYTHFISKSQNPTLLVMMGTKKGHAIFTKANPRLEKCGFGEQCIIFQSPEEYLDKSYELFAYCDYCKTWNHKICLKLTDNRYKELSKSKEKFFCRQVNCIGK